MIWPGSALARSGPQLVVAAELVETSRLWGRICARIDPAWVETGRRRPAAPQLLRTAVERRSGAASRPPRRSCCSESPCSRRAPCSSTGSTRSTSRELFIRHALVERDWTTRHRFFAQNQQALDDVAAWEERTRRRDIVVDDETLFALYDARIPADVTSGRHFDSWWKKASRSNPDLLTFTTEMLIAAGLGAFRRRRLPRPVHLRRRRSGTRLRLRPRPAGRRGHRDDPARGAGQGRPGAPSNGRSPGCAADLAVALIRSLPKTLRRNFVPVPDFARAALARIDAAGWRRRRSTAVAAGRSSPRRSPP